MFHKYLFVLSCVLLSTIHTNGQYNYYGNRRQKQNPKAVIQLYYEALCPACRNFDTTTFKETVLELGPYLDVQMYPYGNAQTTGINLFGGYEFKSQHGPAETYGNKLHACAINILQNTTAAVLFNSCLMEDSHSGNGSHDNAADVCGSYLYVNSEAIKQCAKSNIGSQLLKYYGDESKKAGFKTVPTVLINGVPASIDHFKEDVYNALRYL